MKRKGEGRPPEAKGASAAGTALLEGAGQPPEKAKPKAGIMERLRPVYERMPEFAFLDRSTMWLIAIAIALYFVFVGAVFLATPKPELSARIYESPLAKNAALALLPEENYAYDVSVPGQSASVSYRISSSPSCAGVLVSESPTGTMLCLLRNGNLAGDREQSNSSLGNQSILLFSPWMLAVSDSFSWQINATFFAGGAQLSIPTYFRSAGVQQVLGRKSFTVSVASDLGSPSTLYIDAEKRVLLYADMDNASAWLVSAPFALNQSQLPQK